MVRRFALLFASLLAIACAGPPTEPFAVRVTWGLDGTSALPEGVSDIEIVTCIRAGEANEECSNVTCSILALTGTGDMEVESCRPTAGTEMYMREPVLVRSDLPTDAPVRFELVARLESGEVGYAGQAGPFVLGEGERRFVSLHMYDVNRTSSPPTASVRRFLHTATLLPDGRILVAGGFDTAQRLASCPVELSLAPEARCFMLTATDEAIAIDVATGTATTIREPMLRARAGHTATALPDGRVLIAGGAPNAILAMTPQGASSAAGYAMRFFPRLADGTAGALANFEVFDAYLNQEEEDIDRDGDPARGAFLGTAGQPMVGSLNRPRFLHAAVATPSNPDRVLLAGGMGGPGTGSSFEIFDNRRVGGYGVYLPTTNRLNTPRAMPSAVAVGGQVWIFGGALARTNGDLAEIWMASGFDPNGLVRTASDMTTFGSDGPHPEWALLRPSVASTNNGAIVVGWYGPQCLTGDTVPMFPSSTDVTQFCVAPSAGTPRSFTIDQSGAAVATDATMRAFGEVATLGCFKPGRAERYSAMTGGFSSANWIGQPAIDVFDGGVDAMGAATRLPGSLSTTGRFFHVSVGLPGFGIVTIGGMTFDPSVEQILFRDTTDFVFLPSPNYDEC